MIFGHGNELHRYAGLIKSDFSSNIVPGGMSPLLQDYLRLCVGGCANYPEPDAGSLALQLAHHHGLDASQVVVTNGSAEAFYLLAQCWTGESSTIVIPSFAEYEDAARVHRHACTFVKNSELDESTRFSSKIIWLGNPNNPDGKVFSPQVIRQLCQNNPDSFIIVDEAYAGLCSDFQSVVPMIEELSNLVVVRSLTKVFAIAGLRLGYVLASKTICNSLMTLKMPWSVNSLALAAGGFVLDRYQELLPDVALLLSRSQQLQRQLSQFSQLEVFPSLCNYFLIQLIVGVAGDLKRHLIENQGILIRDASNFRGLNERYIRVAVQSDEANQNLVKGIEQWLSKF
jgi:threonine-phosphate decarboxylase